MAAPTAHDLPSDPPSGRTSQHGLKVPQVPSELSTEEGAGVEEMHALGTDRGTPGPRRYTQAAPGWSRRCGWCTGTWPVATDGRHLVCSNCRH